MRDATQEIKLDLQTLSGIKSIEMPFSITCELCNHIEVIDYVGIGPYCELVNQKQLLALEPCGCVCSCGGPDGHVPRGINCRKP